MCSGGGSDDLSGKLTSCMSCLVASVQIKYGMTQRKIYKDSSITSSRFISSGKLLGRNCGQSKNAHYLLLSRLPLPVILHETWTVSFVIIISNATVFVCLLCFFIFLGIRRCMKFLNTGLSYIIFLLKLIS